MTIYAYVLTFITTIAGTSDLFFASCCQAIDDRQGMRANIFLAVATFIDVGFGIFYLHPAFYSVLDGVMVACALNNAWLVHRRLDK